MWNSGEGLKLVDYAIPGPMSRVKTDALPRIARVG